MYVIYSSMHGYEGPANVEEMVEFLSSDEKAGKRLWRIGIDQSDIKTHLVGRDGEPFRFRWSVKTNPMGPPYPICFEELGIDGVRQVGFSQRKVVDVTEDSEYDRLFKGRVKKGEVEN